MAKFIYRMQNILDIKRKLEEQEKINYGLANQKLAEENKKLQDLLVRRAGYDKQMKEYMTGNIDLRQIRQMRHALNTMKTLIRNQIMQVHAAERNVEIVRKRLKDVMVERKTQEKLREHAFEEFKQEMNYEENKAVDELVSYAYHRAE